MTMTREEIKLLAIDTKLDLAEKMQEAWGYLLKNKEATKQALIKCGAEEQIKMDLDNL